jgi:hypothetical protein
MATQTDLMSLVDGFLERISAARKEAGPYPSTSELVPLPAVHDAGEPWAKPLAPCASCGAVQWRAWCHDERHVWQWICNRCRPLVVRGPAASATSLPRHSERACHACGGTQFWERPPGTGRGLVCARCHPDPRSWAPQRGEHEGP